MSDVALPSLRLDDRVAIITGASSGLGERFARALHAAGAAVVITARRCERLAALHHELGAQRVVAVTGDVTVDTDCRAIADKAIEAFGRIDILVNNAGVAEPVPAEHESPGQFRRVVDVNLNAVFAMTHAVADRMLEQRPGTIVNVTSILGLVGSAPINQASYCASKGALVNLTRELALQWAARGVRVNAIAPGWFASEMTGDMLDSERGRAFIRRNCPMGRSGRPDELDGPLLFLCSDASAYCTGHTLVVDGGWTAR